MWSRIETPDNCWLIYFFIKKYFSKFSLVIKLDFKPFPRRSNFRFSINKLPVLDLKVLND